jgi:hypothetical protein
LLFSVPVFEQAGSAADVETIGDLKVSGIIDNSGGEGIKFPDGSTQAKACSGCAGGILSISLGGTGGDTATEARTNLGVPGLATPNTFTAGQTIQGALTTTGNLYLPVTSASAGIIYAGADRLIHSYGTNNFFSGANAGNLTMSGSNNTGSGRLALISNTIGNCNTATGTFALLSNTVGSFNTASGDSALYNNTGSYNTATGRSALYSNTIGSYNTAVGQLALESNTEGWSNTAGGSGALYHNISGYYNTASGELALYTNTTGYHNTGIGYNADVSAANLNNATAIGSNAIVNATNKVRIGDTHVTVIEGQVGWSNPSDIRLKTDVADVSRGLDFIKQLRPVEFSMKEGNGRKDFGFIAQDIEAILGSDYNVLGIGADPDRTLSLRYTDFIAPMVKAMQEQQEMIESQNETIRTQREQILSLEGRLARIESMLASK